MDVDEKVLCRLHGAYNNYITHNPITGDAAAALSDAIAAIPNPQPLTQYSFWMHNACGVEVRAGTVDAVDQIDAIEKIVSSTPGSRSNHRVCLREIAGVSFYIVGSCTIILAPPNVARKTPPEPWHDRT